MHVHYQSKLQARKALSKNGKVFGGRMMIGVLPCIDKVGPHYRVCILRQRSTEMAKCLVFIFNDWCCAVH